MIKKVFFYLLVPEVFLGNFLHVREDKPRESGKKSCELRHTLRFATRFRRFPEEGRGWGGGGGKHSTNFCIFVRGGSAPMSNPLPFYIPFFTKRVPVYLLLTNGGPFLHTLFRTLHPFGSLDPFTDPHD